MNTVVAILIGVCGVLFGLVCLKSKKIDTLKKDTQTKEQTIAVAKDKIQEVKNVQQEIKKIETESTPPEIVPSATSGDSDSRIERLNQLFNNQ